MKIQQASRFSGYAKSQPEFKGSLMMIGLLLVFLAINQLPACTEQSRAEAKPVTINVDKNDIPTIKFYVGSPKDILENPRCIDYDALYKATPEYDEIQKEIKNKFKGNDKAYMGTGKYWIYFSQAQQRLEKCVTSFAKNNNITYICDRKSLLDILKKNEEFKSKSDSELLKQFDVTSQIVDFIRKKRPKDKIVDNLKMIFND